MPSIPGKKSIIFGNEHVGRKAGSIYIIKIDRCHVMTEDIDRAGFSVHAKFHANLTKTVCLFVCIPPAPTVLVKLA